MNRYFTDDYKIKIVQTILSFPIFLRVLQMDAEEIQHQFIYIDEAGFIGQKQEGEAEISLATGL